MHHDYNSSLTTNRSERPARYSKSSSITTAHVAGSFRPKQLPSHSSVFAVAFPLLQSTSYSSGLISRLSLQRSAVHKGQCAPNVSLFVLYSVSEFHNFHLVSSSQKQIMSRVLNLINLTLTLTIRACYNEDLKPTQNAQGKPPLPPAKGRYQVCKKDHEEISNEIIYIALKK